MTLFLVWATIESKITQVRKFWNQELYARERIRTNEIGEKIQNPRNTQEKTFCTYEIPTRKRFGPTEYARRHNSKITLDPWDL